MQLKQILLAKKQILLTKKQILKNIQKHVEDMNRRGIYSVFTSSQAKQIFSMDKPLNAWKDFYNMYMSCDNYGFMSIELGKKLEELIANPNIVLGLHRTFIYKENGKIYESDDINNILDQGLIITGDSMQGTEYKKYEKPSKNISPLNNIYNAVMMIKGTYKGSNTGFLFALPKEFVTDDLELKKEYIDKLYLFDINSTRLNPKYNIGFVSQDNGICNFFDKDEYLAKAKENRQL